MEYSTGFTQSQAAAAAEKGAIQSMTPAERMEIAISSIEGLRENLYVLLQDIDGIRDSSAEAAGAVPALTTTLRHVLSEGPNAIHKHIAACYEVMEEIRSRLFG